MKIAMAGGSGFLGQALSRHFESAGHEVVVLTRRRDARLRVRQVEWDGGTVGPWARELDGAGAIVNLAGKSVNCRYTAKNRREILESRVHPTRAIGQALAGCRTPPAVWLNASTATIYQHALGPAWDESGAIAPTREAKDAFSIEVAQAWEEELEVAPCPKTRKVALRAAMVLGHAPNSVFPVLRRLVRFGLGGKMGSGRQFVSWIHEADFCRAVEWIVLRKDFEGAVNVCAPNPLTNDEMMRILRRQMKAPFGLPAARWMLEIGAALLRTETELILKSRRVVPGRLTASGFRFQFETFAEAAEDLSRVRRSESGAPG